MREIGLYDAKTNLSQIVDEVRRTGQAVTFTKHGQPYADLVPHQDEPRQRRSQLEVLAELEELRKSFPKSSFAEIQADIADGRR